MTKDEQQALKRLKNDDNIGILPADKGHATTVMGRTDYFDKMNALSNDKQTYEELKHDPTPARFNINLTAKYLGLKKLTLLTLNATMGTEVLCSTTTETLRTTETVQTWYTDVTYSILL